MNNIQLLDGGMGSEFIKRGIHLPNHIWSAQMNLDAEEIVYKIHNEYIISGANYLTTNTFRTTPRSYRKTGINNKDATIIAKRSLKNAVKIAKSASNDKSLVLGSIAPLEDCYQPNLFPNANVTANEFKQLGNWFKDTDIDIFLLETMNSIAEAELCINEISKFNKPIWVSFVLGSNKCLLSGESLKNALNMLNTYTIECALINCNPIKRTKDSLNIVADNWDKKWGIYPNLGIGEPSPDGKIDKIHSNEEFLSVATKAVKLGATILGGCCGSSPYHIKLLHDEFIK